MSAVSAALKLRRLAIFGAVAATTILWVCSTPFFANWLASSLECQYPPKSIQETPQSDAAILLGGAVGQPLPPRTEPRLTHASDRVLHAARLYRAGKVKLIVVSAGNIPWLPAVKPEAELI